MAKKEVTKAPTGLSIVRSDDKFTASWKIGDKDYFVEEAKTESEKEQDL